MKKHVIFSNYYSSERENYIREWLMESRGEDNSDWKTIDDIPDDEVWEEMAFNEEMEWSDTIDSLKRFFDGKMLLVCGSVGLWYGTFPAGKVITYDELYQCWNDCDYVEIYNEGGHFFITASHHDGTNCYEVKILTDKGYELYDNWNYGYHSRWENLSEKEVHEKLWNDSHYSHIPHFAR